MKKEFVGLLIFSLMVFLSSGIFALGETCSIIERSSCSGNIVMGISSTSNAHGELANQGNYDKVLCCNFPGSLTCDGQNKIIGLSSSTNAHAEIPTQTSSTVHIVEVNMDEFSSGYSFDDLTINVGDTVRWVQTDMMAHTITSDDNSDGMMNMGDGELFSSGNMDTGDVYEFTFNEVGEFLYYCDYHLMMGMKGKVTVIDASSTELCYEDLRCMSTSLDCIDTDGYSLSMFSLSGSTNAHIGNIDNYDINICCVPPQSNFWSKDGTSEISNLEVFVGITSVKIVLINSKLPNATEVSFEILEDDLFFDDHIKTINATINDRDATVEWIITLEDLEKTPNDYDKFYFKIGDKESGYLDLDLQDFSACGNVTLCSEYDSETSCGNDNCQIGGDSIPTNINCNDPTINCYCSWSTQCGSTFDLTSPAIYGDDIINAGETCDGSNFGPITGCSDFDSFTGGDLSCYSPGRFNTSLCTGGNGPGVVGDGVINTGETCDGSNFGPITGCSDFDSFTGGDLSCDSTGHFDTSQCNGGSGGTCTFIESTNDDCSDGFLTYSWTSAWTGPAGDEPEECSDGSKVIECPVQIQLPFFGIYNLIVSMLLIAMVYFIMFKKKKLKKFIK